jgi:tRNA-splicing ligase RtcB (3'-phosphate/5'-hydroxy nucleic acid ligase)
MTEASFSYHAVEHGAPIKAWDRGVSIEDAAWAQLRNVAALPFIHKHVAAMPDTHWGMGATVGSVIATRGAIVPAAVGVDIGCGMMAVRTNVHASQLPDSLVGLRGELERRIPHGRTDNGGDGDRGAWGSEEAIGYAVTRMDALGLQAILDKHPKLGRWTVRRAARHLGTLGTGNHFLEICLDVGGAVWIMLHSGSRGIGNAIGNYFIERAKADMRRWFINLPDADLAYLPEGSDLFGDYVAAVAWAQDFAATNRLSMMNAALGALDAVVPGATAAFGENSLAVNCHHNYVAKEHHFGANVWVTRKGAVRARPGDLGIIPGSMGARSYIVRGKGNPESFMSCSHGAGRAMSRTEARRRFTVADHVAATEGVECKKDESVLDETPAAYKPIDAVMAAQADLVEIVYELRQIVCVKG